MMSGNPRSHDEGLLRDVRKKLKVWAWPQSEGGISIEGGAQDIGRYEE